MGTGASARVSLQRGPSRLNDTSVCLTRPFDPILTTGHCHDIRGT